MTEVIFSLVSFISDLFTSKFVPLCIPLLLDELSWESTFVILYPPYQAIEEFLTFIRFLHDSSLFATKEAKLI
jgi:hypothetical protein